MDSKEHRARAEANRRRMKRLQAVLLVLLALIAALLVYIALRGVGSKDPESSAPRPSDSPSARTDAPRTEAPESTPAQTQAPVTQAPAPATTQAPAEESWRLLLVNAEHPLPEGFRVKLKALRNGHQVDERIYPELQQMFDDARAAGIYPYINESYRTTQRQQEIMDKYVARYEAEGMSHEAAVQKALTVVAVPGTSEHELGLALDIIAEYDNDSTATWNWLRDNCWRYGFILRYPADKEELTGISFEPWHFRYVGVPDAQAIMERGLCLEEYLSE